MNIKSIRLLALAGALLVGCPAALCAAEPAKEEAALVAKLIAAIEKTDFEAFLADGDGNLRQLKKEQFDPIAARVSPRLLAGHDVSYLGELNQHGYHVTVWKISFKDGNDDFLASLSVKDGKVGGFILR
jgi:hypothetical protein